MKGFNPLFLTRQKAMILTGLGRVKLNNFVNEHKVRTFITKGGHRRFFINDLTTLLNESLQK